MFKAPSSCDPLAVDLHSQTKHIRNPCRARFRNFTLCQALQKRNYLLGSCFGWWRWLTMVGIENWRSKPAETRLNDALQFAIPSNRLQWRASQKIRLQVIIDDPAFRSYDVSAHHHITSHVWKNEPFKLPFIINFKGKGRLVTWEASSPNVSMELVMPESPVMGALVVRRR